MKTNNKLNKTVTVNGMMAVTKSDLEMDYVQFLPDNPSIGQTDAFCGRGLGRLLSNGSFEFTRTKRLRHKPEFKGDYASLSFGADGNDRVTFVVPNSCAPSYPPSCERVFAPSLNTCKRKDIVNDLPHSK